MTSVPLAEAKNRLSEYVSEVERTHDRVTITRHGRTAAILISADDLAALEETVELLATPGASAAIAEGLADLAAGRVADNAALWARYTARWTSRAMFESQRAQNVISLGCQKRSEPLAWNSSSARSPRILIESAPSYAANSPRYGPPDAAATASSTKWTKSEMGLTLCISTASTASSSPVWRPLTH
jgi:antitoxin YefM